MGKLIEMSSDDSSFLSSSAAFMSDKANKLGFWQALCVEVSTSDRSLGPLLSAFSSASCRWTATTIYQTFLVPAVIIPALLLLGIGHSHRPGPLPLALAFRLSPNR